MCRGVPWVHSSQLEASTLTPTSTLQHMNTPFNQWPCWFSSGRHRSPLNSFPNPTKYESLCRSLLHNGLFSMCVVHIEPMLFVVWVCHHSHALQHIRLIKDSMHTAHVVCCFCIFWDAPVLERVVDHCLEHQSVPHGRRSSELEHVHSFKSGVSTTQPTMERQVNTAQDRRNCYIYD